MAWMEIAGLGIGVGGAAISAVGIVVPRWLDRRGQPAREQRELLLADARDLRGNVADFAIQVRRIDRLYEKDARDARRAELYPVVRARLDAVHDPLRSFVKSHLDVTRELMDLDEQLDLAGSSGHGWFVTAYFAFEDVVVACNAIIANTPVQTPRLSRSEFLRLANERASLPNPLGAVAEHYEATLRVDPKELLRSSRREYARTVVLGAGIGACLVLSIFSFADLL